MRPVGSSGGGYLLTADLFVPDGTTDGVLPDRTAVSVPIFALDPSLEYVGLHASTERLA